MVPIGIGGSKHTTLGLRTRTKHLIKVIITVQKNFINYAIDVIEMNDKK